MAGHRKRGPVVVDTDVYSSRLVPNSRRPPDDTLPRDDRRAELPGEGVGFAS